MIATLFASFVCAVLALLSAAISAVADRPWGWRIGAVILAVVAVSFWWLP